MIGVIVWIEVEVCEGRARAVARFNFIARFRVVVSVRVGVWELYLTLTQN